MNKVKILRLVYMCTHYAGWLENCYLVLKIISTFGGNKFLLISIHSFFRVTRLTNPKTSQCLSLVQECVTLASAAWEV